MTKRTVKNGDIFYNKQGDQAVYKTYYGNRQGIFEISGSSVVLRISDVKAGNFKDRMKPSVCGVGFIGHGKYPSKINHKHTKAYSCWIGMLRRCYDENNSHFSSYGGCGIYVEDIWHNFQNFAKWYYSISGCLRDNHHLEIDKDIKGGGVYSEDTCTLIPRQLNSLLRNRNPEKDIRNKHKLFDSRVSILGKRLHLKGFQTLKEIVLVREIIINSSVNFILKLLDECNGLPEKGLEVYVPDTRWLRENDRVYVEDKIKQLELHIKSKTKEIQSWVQL